MNRFFINLYATKQQTLDG